jgi:hypothetical protein
MLRVSRPSLASLKPQAWRSWWGCAPASLRSAFLKPAGEIGGPPLREEHMSAARRLPTHLAQPSELRPGEWMRGRRSTLGAPYAQVALVKIDLIPAQRAELDAAQAVPVRHEDHQGEACSVASLLASARSSSTSFSVRCSRTVPFTDIGPPRFDDGLFNDFGWGRWGLSRFQPFVGHLDRQRPSEGEVCCATIWMRTVAAVGV